MINLHVKELIKEFDSKVVNVARVNTEDGRTFSLSLSMKISEDLKQNGNCGVAANPFNTMRSPVECDTSGCMNSSPDSERSGILNPPEFVNNVACDVDDFLNSFNDPTFHVANLTEGITDEAECESIADSDCDTIGVEYFVVDELVGKRFNDKTQKYEFLLRPKRYIPKNEIIWNPIDNLDNFDISLLEHNRLYIEVPDSLKKQEKRKRSVLQDKFLSEVNLPSGKKTDYLPSSAGDLRNASFDKMYQTYICSGSADNTLDVEMGNIAANFEELVPVVPVLIDSQATDPPTFHESEMKEKKRRQPRQRAEKAVYVYHCADCDFNVTQKRKMMQHVRQHLPQHIKTNNLRGSQRRKLQDTPNSKHPKRFHRNKTKLADKSSSEEHSSTKSKPTKGRKINNVRSPNTVPKKKNSKEIENTTDENGPKIAVGVILEQESKNTENYPATLPEDRSNQSVENSEKIFYSAETKFKNNEGCAGVEDVQKEENKRVRKRRTVLKIKPLKSNLPVNGTFTVRQTRKRSSSTIENEESNKVSKFSGDDPIQHGTVVPDEHPKEVSHPESRYDHAGGGDHLPESTPILLPKKTKSKLPISFPIVIPLSVLENSGIDVERLRKRLRTEREKENSITREKHSLPISAAAEIPPLSPRADFTNVDLVSSQVKAPTELFPPCSLQSKVMENMSTEHSEDAATDEEVILSIVNRMLDILDADSSEKSKDATDKINSTELNQRLQNPSSEKDSTESDETFKDVSVDTNTLLASQELKLPSVFTNVGSIEKSLKKDDGSANSASEDLRFLKCTFCDFVAIGLTKYKEHTIRSHTDKFTRCLFCTKSLMSKSSMLRHEREMHAEYLPFVRLPRVDSCTC